jgi:hypothetical protein
VTRFLKIVLVGAAAMSSSWGFFAHQKVNRLAVFILPPEMIGFYKKNIQYLTEASVNPDRRRYAVADEATKHYIDLDDYGDSAVYKLPRYWNDAVEKYGEDTLEAHGIVPWHVTRMYYQLKEAFLLKDPQRILKVSAELGHYVADANVPLHTTRNYDGQLTGQNGIHAFWESRLPELYFGDYDFFVGKASHLDNIQLVTWHAIRQANEALDSVLRMEKLLFEKSGDKKFSFETKGKQTVKVISDDYAKEYHTLLSGMVERQLRSSVKMVGDIWYTAWVDAGQPDLKMLINYQPTEAELKIRQNELKQWKETVLKTREHEVADH